MILSPANCSGFLSPAALKTARHFRGEREPMTPYPEWIAMWQRESHRHHTLPFVVDHRIT